MSKDTWLEVELIVEGELAEAVAEVLGRYVTGGVAIESTAVTAEADDSQGRATGPLRVCGYLPVDEHLEENRRRLEEALWYLGRIRPLPPPRFRSVQEQDWSQAWKEHYRPILIGKRLVIVPAWLESPDPSRVAIRMDPGMAFGTGTHPTTQLCLEFIDALFDPMRGSQYGNARLATGERVQRSAVIDLGCGSGILAVAALKLGAQAALAVDIDAEAVRATRLNADLNGVSADLEAGLGSLAEVRRGDFSLRTAPLVLANILAVVIVNLLDEGLGELLEPGGVLVLSGILEEQASSVEAALERQGLRLLERRQAGDWVALAARRV
jgi:ribosomal protein L11 methyltransferase